MFIHQTVRRNRSEFKIKDQVDYNAILNHKFPHNKEFILSDNDCKDIVKFLKDNENKSTKNEFIAKEIDSEVKSIKGIVQEKAKAQADAKYLKLFFNDSRKTTICYKLDIDNNKLTPCYTQYQNKIFFVNKKFAEEFGYHQNGIKPTVESKKTTDKETTDKEANRTAGQTRH